MTDTVYSILSQIRKVSGKLDKRAILKKHADNDNLKEFLRLCYEPRVNLYMRKLPQVPVGNLPLTRAHLDKIVEKLMSREVTGNAAKEFMAEQMALVDQEGQELLALLIDRDVKAGISGNSVNDTWPGLVTDVPYMRCCLPKDSKLNEWPWARGVFSQIKADGMFANVDHGKEGTITISSRSGSPFPIDQFGAIVADVSRLIPKNVQLHGELLVKKSTGDGMVTLPRQEGNGMLNKVLQGGSIPPNHIIIFEAWDAIPLDEAKVKNKYKKQYTTRFTLLQEWLFTDSVTRRGIGGIELIETRIVYSLKEAYGHYREALGRGLEGTVVKHPDAIWEDSTSKNQVKMKLEFEVDLRFRGFNPGNGKNKDLFGSIRCESEDGKLKVSAHGFTDKLRAELFDELKDGDVVTVKSNSIMPPENKDYYSLFLPIFVEVRRDKKTADDLPRILEQYENAIAMGGV